MIHFFAGMLLHPMNCHASAFSTVTSDHDQFRVLCLFAAHRRDHYVDSNKQINLRLTIYISTPQ